MIKIATWTIINNELPFIKDIIDYHLSWADQMYFLDTGSNDGTLEYLQERAFTDARIILEEYPIKYKTQYDKSWDEMDEPFPEVIVRNYAIEQVSNLGADWIVRLDGDECFLDTTRKVIEKAATNPGPDDYVCVGHSTINPVCFLEEHPLERRGDCQLYDPHVRIWMPNREVKYIPNPAFGGDKQYHCIPDWKGGHLFHHPFVTFTEEPIHFHLHWMYGNKIEKFFNRKGIFDKKEMIKDQEIHKYSSLLPEIFWQRRQEWLER